MAFAGMIALTDRLRFFSAIIFEIIFTFRSTINSPLDRFMVL